MLHSLIVNVGFLFYNCPFYLFISSPLNLGRNWVTFYHTESYILEFSSYVHMLSLVSSFSEFYIYLIGFRISFLGKIILEVMQWTHYPFASHCGKHDVYAGRVHVTAPSSLLCKSLHCFLFDRFPIDCTFSFLNIKIEVLKYITIFKIV